MLERYTGSVIKDPLKCHVKEWASSPPTGEPLESLGQETVLRYTFLAVHFGSMKEGGE